MLDALSPDSFVFLRGVTGDTQLAYIKLFNIISLANLLSTLTVQLMS